MEEGRNLPSKLKKKVNGEGRGKFPCSSEEN